MKHPFKTVLPLCISIAAGAAAAVLRRMLYATAVDEKNLIIAAQLPELLLWVLTAAALAALAVLILPRKGSGDWADNFRPGIPAALGCLALAAGLAVTAAGRWSSAAPALERAAALLGALCAPVMLWVAVCRVKGKRPFFGCHGLVCVCLCLHLLSQYRVWCGNPQLQDYVFDILALVCMGLFAYQQTAFETGLGSRRGLLLSGLMGSFFAIAAAAVTAQPLLYAGGAVWMLTNLCRLSPAPAVEEA